MKKIVKHWYDKLLSMVLMLLGFGGSAGLAGCKISVAYGGPPDDYNVKIIPSALSFSAEGGIKEIKIETDSKWTISGCPPYIYFNTTSGYKSKYVEVKVSKNVSSEERRATINVTGEYDHSGTLTIIQSGE